MRYRYQKIELSEEDARFILEALHCYAPGDGFTRDFEADIERLWPPPDPDAPGIRIVVIERTNEGEPSWEPNRMNPST